MLFLIISIALTLIVALMLAAPLWRVGNDEDGIDPDVALYRDQLAEVDRDLERGLLLAEDADRARTEISRRLLAADTTQRASLSAAPKRRSRRLVVGLLAGIVALPSAMYFGTDRMLVAAGVSPQTVATWKDRLSISLDVPIGDRTINMWAGPIFSGLGAPGYPDIPLAARIAASEQARETRMSQLQAEQLVLSSAGRPPISPEQTVVLDDLRGLLETDPSDIQGWQQLVSLAAGIEHYDTAARAQSQVIALLGQDATSDDHTRLAILLVLAAQGYVSPEAEAQLQIVLTEDPSNIAARYYYGLLFFETDRPDRAFRLFSGVINDGQNDNPFVQWSRNLVEEAAFRAGVEYTLPPPRGPSLDDITAATDMSPEDREAMIANMVNGLSNRLANQGGPVEDWSMLINALTQLGDVDEAREILAEARDLFATSPEAMQQLDATAALSGLSE